MNQKRIIKKIKFEGEYLNGKRWNGKGFNHEGKEVFEIRNGEGLIKEYNNKGKLIFEGEYKNGEISGKAKEYNNMGNLVYEGGYLKGKRNGKGKEYHYKRYYLGFFHCVCCRIYDEEKEKKFYYIDSIYEEEYLNGKRNDKGFIKEYHSNGKLSFEGEGLNRIKN